MANDIKTERGAELNLKFTGRTPRKNVQGCVFGKLTVIQFSGFTVNGSEAVWLCQCDCGAIKNIRWASIRSGTTSCGCLRIAAITKHGMHAHDLYPTWSGMIARCHNTNSKDYARYGGRGIVVCDEWKNSFDAFVLDIGSRPSSLHSIDRIDNDGPYCKRNCQWATVSEQANNRRTNTILTVLGESMTIAQWSRRIGISSETILARLKSGVSASDAIERPVNR